MASLEIAGFEDLIENKLTQKFQPDKNMQSQSVDESRTQNNYILGALPAAERDYLSEHLELILMPVGKMLYEPGEKLQHAYFPTTCIVSLFQVLANGASAETTGVGKEGMVGVSLIMGGNSMPSSAMVQISGYAYKLDARLLKQEFYRSASMQRLLLRYIQTLFMQIAQTAVCNRHHNLRQQLCRWLLLTLDRLPTNEMSVTHELVANMLGVRREGITAAAGILQHEGLISYRRGHIAVLKRTELEQHACECYVIVRNELKQFY